MVKLDVDLIRACVCGRNDGEEGGGTMDNFRGSDSRGELDEIEVEDGSDVDSAEGPDEDDVFFLKTCLAEDEDDEIDDILVVLPFDRVSEACENFRFAVSGLEALLEILDDSIIAAEPNVVLALMSSL